MINLEEIFEHSQLDELLNEESLAIQSMVDEAKGKDHKKGTIQSMVDFLQKYDGQDIFISFRDTIHTSYLNLKTSFRTPVGFYSYPFGIMANRILTHYGFKENEWESLLKIDEHRMFQSHFFPFKVDSEFMFLFHLGSKEGIFYTSNLDDSRIPEYVDRIKSLYSDNEEALKVCDYFVTNGYSIGSPYVQGGAEKRGVWGLWLLLYRVLDAVGKTEKSKNFTIFCHKLGINGFVDNDGLGMIHPNEKTQGVFFKPKTTFDDVMVLSKTKGQNFPLNRDKPTTRYNIPTNKYLKESIEDILGFMKRIS